MIPNIPLLAIQKYDVFSNKYKTFVCKEWKISHIFTENAQKHQVSDSSWLLLRTDVLRENIFLTFGETGKSRKSLRSYLHGRHLNNADSFYIKTYSPEIKRKQHHQTNKNTNYPRLSPLKLRCYLNPTYLYHFCVIKGTQRRYSFGEKI